MKQIILLMAFIALTACAEHKKPVWYKGNTHTHSTYSDGDTDIRNVIKWYHDNDYHFLFLTDHNYPLNTDSLKLAFDKRPDFLFLNGNEVSDYHAVHVSALFTKNTIPIGNYLKDNGISDAEFQALPNIRAGMLARHVKSILEAGGIPILNHPNFSSGLQVADILPVKELRHFELFNGHPYVYNWGKENHSAVEIKWDSLLIQGNLLYGVASDDLHQMQKIGGEFANPGRGWIMVNAASLTAENILKAIKSGDFYASSGVFLEDYCVENNVVSVVVDEKATLKEMKSGRGYPRNDLKNLSPGFIIEFIGYNGKVLQTEKSLKAKYKIQPNDRYVRVRISYNIESDGKFHAYYAWTQPVEAIKGFFN